MTINLVNKKESFEFEYSIEDTSIRPYNTYRIEYKDGEVIWFGLSVNWKRIDNKWHVLGTNHNAKPLEKYLPDIVYGSDRTIWIECDIPEYEKLYLYYNRESIRDQKIHSLCG